jgi:formylglycine-generating enzyme required for sulfatase activity
MDFNRLEGADLFEYMSTLVTQKHWATVMGNNPSKFKLGAYTVVVDIQGSSVYMQPDNPVEQVSWNDTQTFIRKLNELSLHDDPLLYQLIVDHHAGDQYQLPTRARWLAVATNHGTAKGTYFFGDQESELGSYAWYDQNSHGTTHPVAELRPFIVDGGAFYDILGNVSEWMEDSQEVDNCQESFSHPCMEKFAAFRQTSKEYVLSGGRWAASVFGSRTLFENSAHPNFRSDSYGFRLVRIRVVCLSGK